MSYLCDINDQYLEKLSDDLQRELQRILQDIKSDKEDNVAKSRQVPVLNSIMINVIKLMKLRNKQRSKLDGF
jgi:hypothetical protein